MHHHRSALAALATAAVAVLAVGCGPSDDSSDGKDSGSGSTAASPSTTGGTDADSDAQGSDGGSDTGAGAKGGGGAPSDGAHDDHLHGAGSLCDVGPLDFKLTGHESAAEGANWVYVVITNGGNHPCHTQGYPGLQLDKGSDQVPAHVERGIHGYENDAAKAIELASGDSAIAKIWWDGGNGTCSTKNPDPDTVEITPPDSRHQKALNWTFGPLCGDGALEVSPFHAGTTPGY